MSAPATRGPARGVLRPTRIGKTYAAGASREGDAAASDSTGARASRATKRLVERVGGKWTPTSSARLLERVENVACAIRDAGLGAGDRVALVSHNSVDWIVCDFATLFAGCVVVPIYPTQALDHIAHILETLRRATDLRRFARDARAAA